MPSSTSDLKKFAQSARRSLREQVAARLDQVLRTDSAALRERDAARRELTQQIAETSKKAVIDRVAYTWFNRFCALRFMDANRYNRIGVVSPAEGFTQPEILQEAKNGYIDEDLHKFVDCQAVFDLLGERKPSADPQQEAYRMLLVGACNALNRAMPFLFEPIADYTELLMPQDLLSEHSILHDLREAMTPDACQDVEVIGWLYQFYISERKDEVFEALKANQKIAPEDIPAATQLFTPHWIVRYLVENSLGRLWMLNRPASRLVEKMDYYIKPEEPETDYLRIASPEEIKVCDPACGSGHMLTYAFDLLYSIYEEEGYPAADIPRLILEKNLYGIEIDERAGDLAAFALVMKARGRDRRFFSRGIQPNICVLENITFTDQELKEYAAAMGRDLFTEPLMLTLNQFEQASNYGALIRPILADTTFIRSELERRGLGGSIFLYSVHERVIRILQQAEYLNSRYQVVVANPPYMGDGGMNEDLKDFAKNFYPQSKSDCFAMFIERGLALVPRSGYVSMITMESWMFLTSYERFRVGLLNESTILQMVHMPYLGKGGTSLGINFGTAATILTKQKMEEYKGFYCCLRYFETDALGIPYHFPPNNERSSFASSRDFKKIPSLPISYWFSEKTYACFENYPNIQSQFDPQVGLQTSNTDRFIRLWHEVSRNSIYFNAINNFDAKRSGRKWFPLDKGGDFRKWYGNNEHVVNWANDGFEIKEYVAEKYPYLNGNTDYVVKDRGFFFMPGVTWTKVTSGQFSVRQTFGGSIFSDAGMKIPLKSLKMLPPLSCYLNSKVAKHFLSALSPTLNFEKGAIGLLPYKILPDSSFEAINEVTELSKVDWDSFETSWDFAASPLLLPDFHMKNIPETYDSVRGYWQSITKKIKLLEEESNKLLIGSYGLEDELSNEVPINEITLKCNPNYRYPNSSKRIYAESELELLIKADTMREFISYAVGCMFGRYSLDRPGLILANQGETLQDYIRKVYGGEAPPPNAFLPDEDNAIPVLEGEWFSDDITERFKKFLRITFGAQHYEENLAFIEGAIGRDIRSYFLKDFYNQHVKMYQKRPIYWMFSSPRGSFNVLISMHRYQPDTLSVILNRYLREFRGKLEGRKAHLEQVSISASSSQREKTAALKEIEGLNKTLEEIRAYERDVLYPLAVQGIKIDLDDGVKVNYKKFGKALAKITGLSE